MSSCALETLKTVEFSLQSKFAIAIILSRQNIDQDVNNYINFDAYSIMNYANQNCVICVILNQELDLLLMLQNDCYNIY